MHLIVLALLAADVPKLTIVVDASLGKVSAVSVEGEACAVPGLYVAAQAYLEELKACSPVLNRVELKGDDVNVRTVKGAVACALRPPEGRMRIQAGACLSGKK